MHKAAAETAKAGEGSSDLIANVAAGGAGAKADAKSVTGIAKGMKGIVDAAKKAGVELKAAAAAAGGGDNNKEAGKLFANAGVAADAQKAAAAGKAVSAVSGDQILKAIVDAAGTAEGKEAKDATNAVEAAIGADGGAADFDGNKIGKKNEQIAAAIVLRGLAKSGKFANTNNDADDDDGKVQAAVKSAVEWLKEMHTAAEATAKAGGEGGSDLIANVADGGANQAKGAKADAGSVTGIAKGMKGIVEAAKKAGVELKPEAAAGGGDNNKEAGKLFASGGNNAIAGADDAAQKAAAAAGKAVSAVSGDQILKAIVDAAAATAGKAAGQAAKDATNAVEAAIGDGAAAEFGDGKMKKNDQIAAAIVLRGLAKDGKFANANADDDDGKVQAAVKSAVEWLKEMHTAAAETAKAGEGGNDLIANVAAAGADGKGAGAKADTGSVTGIAKGMKGIVEAAKKAGVELKAAAAAGGDNKEAGKLFANGAGVADADAQKAAAAAGKAVSAVSGDQILKAIVDAAATTEGKAAGEATNAVEAAIGDGDAAAEFGDDKIGKKNDQIAAAIVLRGLAKGGKFAVKNY